MWAWTHSYSQGPIAAPPPSTAPATVTFHPVANAVDVDPLSDIEINATEGTLASVSMVNDDNVAVPGVITPDMLLWKPTVPLGYGRTYTVSVQARGVGGTPVTRTSRFSTLTPSNQTKVSLTTTSGSAITPGGTYGVGTVVVAHFDEPITDRAAAQRRLSVTTTPVVGRSEEHTSELQ